MSDKELLPQNQGRLKTHRVELRNATPKDAKEIEALSDVVYGGKGEGYTLKMIRGQIANFPDGQFVLVREDEIVAYCATFIIDEKLALKPHTWDEITGHGFASRHDPNGDYLYGMEVLVSNEFRGRRLGQRLYNARKKLCQDLELKGIVFGGRMPGYIKATRKKKDPIKSPHQYLEAVRARQLKDSVVNFQLRNGFEILGILNKYLPEDVESGGNATHMIWRNPRCPEAITIQTRKSGRNTAQVRVASVQFQVRKVKDFKDFISQMEYFIDVAADYRCDFVVFPELITLALLSAENKKLDYTQAAHKITAYTDRYIKSLRDMAISYNINIIGGSHPTLDKTGQLKNISYVFLRNGEVHHQTKIHPTPSEKYWWNMVGGEQLNVIETDCGPIGVLICYDSEFPELARHLCDQGALMLFVPFCTDERQGYMRVKYCSQARAIENQVYVAMAGVVGNLPDVETMDIHYAESHIITPCDFPFARDGIAASSAPNTETIIFADLNIDDLLVSRTQGTVRNFKDRRFDLYNIEWKK